MKKTLITLMLSLLFFFNLNFVFAQEELKIDDTDSYSTESACVDYALPYPGLLPDSPLYFLKVARDVVTKFFISDSFKKAEYDLLQADKNLNTGYYLFLKNVNKDKMILSSISRGETSFENVIKDISAAKEQGVDVMDFVDKMTLSLQKHKEILTEIKKGTSSKDKEGVEKELKRVRDFQELVNKIKSR
jgi:hypothetical protein